MITSQVALRPEVCPALAPAHGLQQMQYQLKNKSGEAGLGGKLLHRLAGSDTISRSCKAQSTGLAVNMQLAMVMEAWQQLMCK